VRRVFADNQPSRVEVVAYRLRDGVLTRHESSATRDLSELDTFWQAAITDADAAQAVILQSGLSGMAVRIWSSDSPGWRISTDTAMQTSAIAGGPILTGLEMALQVQGQQTSMTKSFLLGPV
jgi:general secretion pathway protein J